MAAHRYQDGRLRGARQEEVSAAAAYPVFDGPRVPIADAAVRGGAPAIAGRLVSVAEGLAIEDSSGCLPLGSGEALRARPGDWVSGRLVQGADGAFALGEVTVHAPRRADSPDPDLPTKLPLLRRRAELLHAARELFRERAFLEVETPSRVICPGLEPHLSAFPAGRGRWLITSPELHLKRLVAAGADRVVEFARAWRDDERGRWHRPEFLMLEWYRAFAGLDAIEADCEALVTRCAAAAGVQDLSASKLATPFERITVREAWLRHAHLDLANLGERASLRRAVEGRGHVTADDDTWDDLFHRVWTAEVEPHLGQQRPVFVHDYPASQAALARTRPEPWGEVAERFELYVAGVEIANAFHELNDPREQRRRHGADREQRRAEGREVYPLDERFLGALESGMPPACGIALGFDRLAALLLGARSLDEITAFPEEGEP